jgi:hypothetical protein
MNYICVHAWITVIYGSDSRITWLVCSGALELRR